MSGLTDDQIAALYEWATHHPRLEKALTAGMLADLHQIVSNMLATRTTQGEPIDGPDYVSWSSVPPEQAARAWAKRRLEDREIPPQPHQ